VEEQNLHILEPPR